MLIPIGFIIREDNPFEFLNNLKKTYPKNLPPFDTHYVDLLLNPIYGLSKFYAYELEHARPIFINFRVDSQSHIHTLSKYFVEMLSNRKIDIQISTEVTKISESEISSALMKEYERVVNKHKRVLPKLPERRKIPYKMLPRGILISFWNSLRLLDDAVLLAEFKRYRNAIIQVLLAREEFSKTLIFLEHFYNQKDITKQQVNTYFKSHWYRLAELARLEDEILYRMEPNSSNYVMNAAMAENYQWTKERYLYVDWIVGWIDPQEQQSVNRYDPEIEGDEDKAFLMEFLDFAQPLHLYLKDFLYSGGYEEIQKL